MTLGKRIAQLRKELAMTQRELADMMKMSRGAISMWELDQRSPDPSDLQSLAAIFKVSIDYLVGRSEDRSAFQASSDEVSSRRRVKLPVVATVKAGLNGVDIAYEESKGYEWVDEAAVDGGTYHWLIVKDDSMIGDGILPGDLVLVCEQPNVKYGEIGVVVVLGEIGTIKRIYKTDASIVLQSSNPVYPPRIFTGDEMGQVRTVGKVKELKRKL